MPLRKCSNCKLDKELEQEFNTKDKLRKKYRTDCKSCQHLKQSDCYQKKREQYKLKARQYRKVLRVKNMKLLWNFLSDHPCKCGETNPVVLELDHLRNKKYNISDVIYCHTWLSIQKELKKCQVLCANCHRKKTAKQLGYYSYMDNIEALLN